LKIAEERNEKLLYQIRSKDEETERMLQQKIALTSIFESDLL
jgi:hypothetical protein